MLYPDKMYRSYRKMTIYSHLLYNPYISICIQYGCLTNNDLAFGPRRFIIRRIKI